MLGEEEIPHYSGHPPPCGSGGKTTPERGVRGINIYPSPYACTEIAARVEERREGGNVKAEMEQWGWLHPLHRKDKIWLMKVLNVSFGGI